MPAKRFTILIIPEGSHQVRRFGVSRTVAKRVLAISVVLALGFAGLVTDYMMTSLDRNELQRLQVENLSQDLESRLSSIVLASIVDTATGVFLSIATEASTLTSSRPIALDLTSIVPRL